MMKIAIVYSSKTGNTKRIATSIQEIITQAELYSVEHAPTPDEFDVVIMGYWADRGNANKEAIEYMKKITGKKVAVFFTLGAYPDSEHAQDCYDHGIKNFGEGCEVLGGFRCQGAIDPALMEWMKKLPEGAPHAPNPERVKRWQDAASHPDEQDCENAKIFAKELLTKLA